MIRFNNLLAKSCATQSTPEYRATLVGHSEAVLEAADVLCQMLENDVVRFFGTKSLWRLWRRAFLVAAWLHDMGKANDHFQRMLRDKAFRQSIRHETLGFWIIGSHLSEWITNFLKKGSKLDWIFPAVLFAISGHHLKFPYEIKGKGDWVIFLGSHSNVSELLFLGQKKLGIAKPPDLQNITCSLSAVGGVGQQIVALVRRFSQLADKAPPGFVATLKSALICADLCGSAVPQKAGVEGLDYRRWIQGRLSATLTTENLNTLVIQKLGNAPPHPFQKQVRDADANTVLIEAGCGSGKTAAAYLWASQHANDRRLFFCYPTTATASEGFAGYMKDPDFESILVTSRAGVDYRLMENMPAKSKSQKELEGMRLEAMEMWPVPAVVCTAHTVLGILQNRRRSLYAWPSLIRAAFVFDEIHAYPPRLFWHLLRFLEIFSNAPVLLMTATLPPARKKMLQLICEKRGKLVEVFGPETREKAQRYKAFYVNEQKAWLAVRGTVERGQKVLWVSNTVKRTMERLHRATEKNLPAITFHSRFRYRDRVRRQREVVEGFLPDRPALVAFTTQVAEMSLDLSADLLVTDIAPPPALIQRMGRLNRFEEEPENLCHALFVDTDHHLPYEETDLFLAQDWLEIVADGLPKSQRDLSETFVRVMESAKEEICGPPCSWTDRPERSEEERNALTDPGFTIEMIREEDLDTGPPGEMVIPMPIPQGNSWTNWNHKGRFLVAPAGTVEYDETEGARYAEKQNEAWII